MKLSSLLIFFLLLTATTQAQHQRDLVVLNDGSIIRGYLIEYIVDSHLTIELKTGEIRKFNADEIYRVKVKSDGEVVRSPKGFISTSDLGTLISSNPKLGSNASFSFRTVNAWEFANGLQVGVGSGLDFVNTDLHVPLYADVQYNFKQDAVTPYIELYGGHLFALEQNQPQFYDLWYFPERRKYEGGILLGGSLGFKNFTKDHFGLLFNAGFLYHQSHSSYTEQLWDGNNWLYVDVKEKVVIRRFRLGIGIVFE